MGCTGTPRPPSAPKAAFLARVVGALCLVAAACACASAPAQTDNTPVYGTTRMFGPNGIPLFGGAQTADAGGAIGVNAFLWRASLDAVGFMPLASADPFGGVIITDWYAPPEAAGERFKLTVYILDRALRADGVKVAVFRQQRDAAEWRDAAVDPATATDLENTILTRAREMWLSANARP